MFALQFLKDNIAVLSSKWEDSLSIAKKIKVICYSENTWNQLLKSVNAFCVMRFIQREEKFSWILIEFEFYNYFFFFHLSIPELLKW